MSTILVLSTAPNLKTAKKLADLLLRQHLAACVSVIQGIHSFYWWKGKQASSREIMLFIKTRKPLYAKLEKEIKKNHPYTVPEILVLPIIQGNKTYMDWVQKETRIA